MTQLELAVAVLVGIYWTSALVAALHFWERVSS